MDWLRRWGRRVRILAHRDAAEREMDEEMRFHVECETRERVAQGMAPDAARRAALLSFGGVERFKEAARDARGVRPLEDLALDFGFALRVLRRSPGFTAAAALTLALGIGATTAIFSVVHGVLMRPLPYPEPDRLAVLWERDAAHGAEENVVAVGNFEAWRERTRSFAALAVLVPAPMTLTGSCLRSDSARAAAPLGGCEPERVAGTHVSPSWFRVVGVRPAIGRALEEREADGDGAPVVVLAHHFWRRLGGDPAVVGRALTLDGMPYTVVGVMPAGFEPPRFGWLDEQDFWMPWGPTESNRAWGRFLLVLGRLRPGVTLAAADAELAAAARQLESEQANNRGWSARVVGLREQVTGDVRPALTVLFGAVGLLLLMAVVNVANLTLAQVRRREQETAIRAALGAARSRLVRHLLTQSAALGVVGAALGVLGAAAGVQLLLHYLPPDVPRREAIGIDGGVLLFTLVASLLATAGFGTLPALRSTRAGPLAVLRERGQGRASGRLGGGALVVAEVALALVLSVVAGLSARSFAALRAVKLGYDIDQVIVMRVSLPPARYPTAPHLAAFSDRLMDAVRALPGVRAAGVASLRPLGGAGPATSVWAADRPQPSPDEAPVADVRLADPEYFRTMRIPLLAGRVFDARDRLADPAAGAPRQADARSTPAVVSRATAALLWPGGNPLGRRMKVIMYGGLTAEVVGVVGDVYLSDPRTVPRSTVYLAATQFPGNRLDIVIRGDADVEGLARRVRGTVAALDATLPVYQVARLRTLVDATVARDRFTAWLLGAFALVALLLAAVGTYGVFAADVARRRHEIGIRIALGARGGSVVLLVLRRGMARAAAGVAIGLAAALVLTRSMRALLFGVTTTDAASYLAVAALLLAVALLATLLPAVRAARITPLVAMRAE